MTTLEKLERVKKKLLERKTRSTYDRGVMVYALELLNSLMESIRNGYKQDLSIDNLEKYLMGGADSWDQFSEGGCSLIYNGDIVERLFPPSIVRKTNYGFSGYYKGVAYLDIQAIALCRAASRIRCCFKSVEKDLEYEQLKGGQA